MMQIPSSLLTIESLQNPKFKEWRKLTHRRERRKQGQYMIEGFHLVEEALLSKAGVRAIILSDALPLDHPELTALLQLLKQPKKGAISLYQLPENLFKLLSQTPTPQGILALVALPDMESALNELLENFAQGQSKPLRLLLLDNVQDPGNVGTMIRTADATAFDGVILGEGTADLFNDKTLRATQGSLFHLPIIEADLTKLLPQLHGLGFESWVTTLGGATDFQALNPPERCALIMGNEGQGVSQQLLAQATTKVKLPMPGRAESLNVGVAAGVLMYRLLK